MVAPSSIFRDVQRKVETGSGRKRGAFIVEGDEEDGLREGKEKEGGAGWRQAMCGWVRCPACLCFFLQEKRGACGGDDKGRRRRDRAGAGWVVGGLGQPTWLAWLPPQGNFSIFFSFFFVRDKEREARGFGV